MTDTEKVIDGDGKPVTLHARVRVCGYRPGVDDKDSHYGTVEQVTDFDVIDGPYGEPQGANPKVTVKFDDGSTDSFTTNSTATGYGQDAPFECDELEVL